MKSRIKNSLILPLLCPVLMGTGCNSLGPHPELQTIQPEARKAREAPGSGCEECANGYLGFSYQPGRLDGKHLQGGHEIVLYLGDCNCEQAEGGRVVNSSGRVHTPIGRENRSTSGTIGRLRNQASSLRGFYCMAGGNPLLRTLNEWGRWITLLQDYYDKPGNVGPIGVVGWPDAWGISAQVFGMEDQVLVEIPGSMQSRALERIRILHPATGLELLRYPASGEHTYELDLGHVPPGPFALHLEFNPGFDLVATLARPGPAP